MIQNFGGKFDVNLTLGVGTTISLSLPASSQVNNVNPIQDYYDCVLIDNDELVRITWQAKAKRKNIKLLALKSSKEFDGVQNKIDNTNTDIYVDCELGDGEMKGEEFAEVLYHKGYTNLTMATGPGQEKFADRPWLKHTGKDSPF